MSTFQESFLEHEPEPEEYQHDEMLGIDPELDLEWDEFDVSPQEFEVDEEIGRRSRLPFRPPPRSLRPRPQSAARRTPRYRPKPRKLIRRHPHSVFVHEPVTCICPERTCPRHGTEYIRWVQSALNDVLGLRLPVTGIMGRETRSAVRSFQERHGLPVTGIAGPDLDSALIAARGGKSPGAEVTRPAATDMTEPAATQPEPGMTEPAERAATSPAVEFDFEWEVAGSDQLNGETCGCPSCRRGEPCRCQLKREGFVTNLCDILPEALEFEPESSFREFEAPLLEVAIPRTIHRLDCATGCPGGLTEAQCAPIVSRAVRIAIKLAKTAADKLEAPTKTEPSKRDDDAKKTARLFKAYFGHDPSKPIAHAGNEPSGVSVAKRFRTVAKELAGGRRIVFRCLPTSALCADDDLTCCSPGGRAFFHGAAPNVVHVCPAFFTLTEASRAGTILHEMLHMLFPGVFSNHRFRRPNAHCYKAFALRVSGHGRDFPIDCACWELNPGIPAQLDECRRRLGL